MGIGGTALPGSGERVLQGVSRRRRYTRLVPFLGPAFIACVAYIDPGNFATNIAGGSKFGYTLVWVIVASNLMAMLIQTLSAKLGIATGRNLAEICRERMSRRSAIALWLQAEAIAMATDLAEFLGAAVGFHLLLGIALFPAAILTGFAAFAILWLLQRACEIQLATLSMGRPRVLSDDIARKCTADSLQFDPKYGAGQNVFDALTRMVDRIDPGYRN